MQHGQIERPIGRAMRQDGQCVLDAPSDLSFSPLPPASPSVTTSLLARETNPYRYPKQISLTNKKLIHLTRLPCRSTMNPCVCLYNLALRLLTHCTPPWNDLHSTSNHTVFLLRRACIGKPKVGSASMTCSRKPDRELASNMQGHTQHGNANIKPCTQRVFNVAAFYIR